MTQKPTHDSDDEPYNASRSMARGIMWAVSMRWAMRFIGLFSTLILARLLTPDDFGVVAMATLISGFLFALSDFSPGMLLIRKKHIDQLHMDTAWTIVLTQRLLTSAVFAALAIPISNYFQEPRVVAVIYVLAAGTLISGFANIAGPLLRRELKFSADFRLHIWLKLLTFCVTVGAAIILRNYWAMVLGQIAGTLAGIGLSYQFHSYRPHFSLKHAKEYLIFGASIVPIRVANTLRERTAEFLVGGTGNASALGSFRVASELSTMFTNEIVTPMGRGLLPNYSRLADQPDELSRMYRKILGLVALLCIPAGVGVSAVADDLVLVLLGPQWGFTASLIEYIALGGVVYALSRAMVNQILVATGREKSAAVLAWVRLAITAPILWAGLELGGVIGLAKATIVAPIACLPIIFLETRRAVTLTAAMLIGLLWRPVIGAAAMYTAIKLSHAHQFDWAIVRLLIDVLIGSAAFITTSLLLWAASGRPDSAEKFALDTGMKLLKSVRDKLAG